MSPSWIWISIARLGHPLLEQGCSGHAQVYYDKSLWSFPPPWRCHSADQIARDHRPVESWTKEKLNFRQTFSPHLMAWKMVPEVCQLISVLEIHGSRISKAEAVYRCCSWECSDNAFCISQRRNALFLWTTLIFVCLFVFDSYIRHNFMLHDCKTKVFQPLFTKDVLGWIWETSDGTRENTRWLGKAEISSHS